MQARHDQITVLGRTQTRRGMHFANKVSLFLGEEGAAAAAGLSSADLASC